MKKDKRITSLLLVAVLLISTAFMTACFNAGDDDDYYEPDVEDRMMIMTLDLESDSENGVEWIFEQDKELFDCEDYFLNNEEEEGSFSELQTFEMVPVDSGITTIRFICEANGTTYTYECEVSEDLNTIKINSSKGESAGTEVEPPDVVLERN